MRSFGIAAKKLARLGFRIFPCNEGGKAPAIAGGFKAASLDLKVARARWKRMPQANIGIATGDGLAIVDTDGKRGEAWLAEQESVHGPLPPTPTAITARGRHRYFKVPKGLGSRTGFMPEVDCKAEGGYVLAPPSIHPTGHIYRWKKGRAPWEISPAPIPSWLLKAIQQPNERELTRTAVARASFSRIIREGASEGKRNVTTAQLTGYLLRYLPDPFSACELLLAWNDARNSPPLSKREVLQTIESIAGHELQRRREETR